MCVCVYICVCVCVCMYILRGWILYGDVLRGTRPCGPSAGWYQISAATYYVPLSTNVPGFAIYSYT